MGKKVKLFNKKNSISFRLVSRSKQDPLINYDDAPKSVLVETNTVKDKKAKERKYGIYYDDDYDYLQHLKDVEEVEEDYYFEEFDPKGTRVKDIKTKDEIKNVKNLIKLPSSLFDSQYQESFGMKIKGHVPTEPKPDWDPEIVEALFDDVDLEDKNNVLDDDFIKKAMKGDFKENESKKNVNWDDYNSVTTDDDMHTIITSGNKTEFTNYSLTSSVIRRNQKLNELDERFEEFFLKDIAENEETNFQEDSENEKENNNLNSVLKELDEHKDKSEFQNDLPKEIILKIAERQLIDEMNEVEDLEEVELRLATGKNDYDDRWDCESVLSNFSSSYNRPKLIYEKKSEKIKINKKTGMPEMNNISERSLKHLNKQNDENNSVLSSTSLISQLSIRNKSETKEEKNVRKKNLKEYMKERRQEKKANKLAFKEEKIKQNNEKVLNKQLAAMKL